MLPRRCHLRLGRIRCGAFGDFKPSLEGRVKRKTQITVDLDQDLYLRLRAHCASAGVSIRKITGDLLRPILALLPAAGADRDQEDSETR